MLPSKNMSIGKVSLVIYDFEKVGDTLPIHVHGDDNNHFTVVAKGKLRAFGNGWEQIIEAGNVVDFEANDPHGFEALEDNSRIVNVVK